MDDLAVEAKDRQGTLAELMQKVEDACTKALAMDCGNDWAQFFRLAWFRTRGVIQTLVQYVDTSPMTQEQGTELFSRHFAVPMCSGLLRLCAAQRPGPDTENWWTSPFQAWVSFAASKANIPEETLLANLANEIDADQRTIERWMSGEPVGKLVWPYAPKVKAALGQRVQERVPLCSFGTDANVNSNGCFPFQAERHACRSIYGLSSIVFRPVFSDNNQSHSVRVFAPTNLRREPEMTFATTLQNQSAVISVPSRFDFRLMQDFRVTADHVINRGTGSEIVVDLTRTDYLDTAGMGMLLVLRDRARAGGKAVVLAHATGAVKESLEVANFGTLFEFR